MFRAPLLKSIPIRSNDFAIELELTAKIAKRDCRIFEVPISYLGRTYREGKKIGWRDGLKARSHRDRAVLRSCDDLYVEDEYGSHVLRPAWSVRARSTGWMRRNGVAPTSARGCSSSAPGSATSAARLLPRDRYVAERHQPALPATTCATSRVASPTSKRRGSTPDLRTTSHTGPAPSTPSSAGACSSTSRIRSLRCGGSAKRSGPAVASCSTCLPDRGSSRA